MRWFALCGLAIMFFAWVARPDHTPTRDETMTMVAREFAEIVRRLDMDRLTLQNRVEKCYPQIPGIGSALRFARPPEQDLAIAAARGEIDWFTLRSLAPMAGMTPEVAECLRAHVEMGT